MEKNRKGTREKEEEKAEEAVETLLGAPVRNLEERIRLLEEELRERELLGNHALAELGTHRLRFEDTLTHMKYASGEARSALQREILRINGLRHSESRFRFQDVAKIQEKLQEAREALRTAKARQALISEAAEGEGMEEQETYDIDSRSKGFGTKT